MIRAEIKHTAGRIEIMLTPETEGEETALEEIRQFQGIHNSFHSIPADLHKPTRFLDGNHQNIDRGNMIPDKGLIISLRTHQD